MNRYAMICRLRGPAYILLTGVIAMMAEWTSIGWGKSWPLYIVLEGLLQLAQRWALSQSYPPPGYGYDASSYTQPPATGAYTGATVTEPPFAEAGRTAPVAPLSGVVPEEPNPGSQSGSQSGEWRS